ncbi:YsnF/AvaK domain-containing protein [Microcoleus sp. FACHB-672]|uniref:YsnF/AvaK domain-containing protein n=1 Tax=Microcoleus sp. FACHB-672 TaxID=2692825 RepID=UPI001687CDD8|nr:DUF2382 domain-containing protein [Microcoleus sp. FACHB-672]MBD2043961.1 DUF2382 domain-containing protein [Microcoleus sp. FACHB-672]
MVNQASDSRSQQPPTNARLKSMVEKLTTQLTNLAVRDNQGLLVGQIKNVDLAPSGQINLVVVDRTTQQSSRLFLLNSKLIQYIDYANKSVFINLTPNQIEQLPEYRTLQTPQVTPSDLPPRPIDRAPESSETAQLHMKTQSTNEYLMHESDSSPEVVAEHEIRLLEERLVIDRSRQKIGEVIVRKEVETRIVEVPVRREKLIIEQVGPEHKQLAEIDLGQGEVTGVELLDGAVSDAHPVIKGEFNSPEVASKILKAIADRPNHGCAKVRIEIVMEDAELLPTYQQWLTRYSDNA